MSNPLYLFSNAASGQLENRGESFEMVEKVMSYSFNYLQYWGTHEGVAKGLPTKIFEKDVVEHAKINWALKHSAQRHETKAVFTKLAPGTAINVTLTGNYVTLEAPYTAKLSAFYHDSESVSRKINAEVSLDCGISIWRFGFISIFPCRYARAT